MLLVVLMKAFQLMLSFTLLVFVHELGHFLAARLFGVRVERFFLFFDMGKPLLRYKSPRSGTVYGIGWLPLGGYCSMSGMVDERFIMHNESTHPQAYEFRAKPAWQRLIIMIGGIVFNLILAVILYTGISFHWGDYRLWSDQVSSGMSFSPTAQKVGFQDNDIILSADGKRLDVFSDAFYRSVITAQQVKVLRNGEELTITIPADMMQRVISDKAGLMGVQIPFVIDSVLAHSPAQKIGLLKGDRLLRVDSTEIKDAVDAQLLFKNAPMVEREIVVARNDEEIYLSIQPDSAGYIGVSLASINAVYPVEKVKYSIVESVPAGIRKALRTLKNYVGDMKYVFTKEGASQMGGLLSIGNLFPKMFDWYSFWSITALLSTILAFMNFLPIPMLDGGYIMFTLWEIITRRRVSDKAILKANRIGLIFLLLLLLYANGNDLLRAFF